MTYITGCDDGGNFTFATSLDSVIKFTRYPELELWTQKAPLPSISAIFPDTQGPKLRIPNPPNSVRFNDLQVTFLVLENLSNYVRVHNWLTESHALAREDIVSDAMQIFMKGDKSPTGTVAKYINMYPVALTGLQQEVDTNQVQYLTATVTFRYYLYKFEG